MASIVQFIETTSTDLDSLPIAEGQFVFTTDTNLLYRDTSTVRVLISTPSVAVNVSGNSLIITTS